MLIGLGDNLNLTLNTAIIAWAIVNTIRATFNFYGNINARKK